MATTESGGDQLHLTMHSRSGRGKQLSADENFGRGWSMRATSPSPSQAWPGSPKPKIGAI